MKKLFLMEGRGIKGLVCRTFVFLIIADLAVWNGPLLCFGEADTDASASVQLPAENAAVKNKSISMDFQDVPLKQILKVFSQQAGMNFVASENIQDKKVTLFLDKVSIDDALNAILSANGFTFERQLNTNIFIVKDAGVSAIALKTRIFKLSYAMVSGADIGGGSSEGIEKILQELLSPNGKIIVDARTNSLLVTDIPPVLASIENVLKELDVKTLQVMISAEILEVSIDTLKRLGVEWGSDTGQFMTYTGGTRSTFWPFKESLFKGATESATIGSANFSSFTAVLKAIKTDSSTQYLARPRLLTLNNKPAEMKIIKKAAVATTTVTTAGEGLTQATQSLERYEVGTILKVTPHINKDDYITMTIEPEVSRVKVSTWSSNYFDPFKRSAKTTIMVKDGETVVIAGLISREDSDSNRRVPILGEVPIFGRVFSRDEKQTSDTELLIFITPYIIKETGDALIRAMQEEFDIAGLEPREGGVLPQRPPKTLAEEIKIGKRPVKGFHTLFREQDSPLSGKELMMEAEVLRLKSPAMAKQ